MSLVIDHCDYRAAKWAVTHWHYSKSMPNGKMVMYGIWEHNIFIGCVIFSRGANKNIGNPYNLEQWQICELTRVALDKHNTPVSQIVTQCIKRLKNENPRLELVVSYADISQGHVGTIYQAMNWVYTGVSNIRHLRLFICGKWVFFHKKTISNRYGNIENIPYKYEYVRLNKHKYLFALNKKMRKKILLLSKPYPKKQDSIHK